MIARRFALSIFILAGMIHSAAGQQNIVTTSNARYELRQSLHNQFSKCLFKERVMLVCLEADHVNFGQQIKTKDYTIVPIYDDCGGSSCGRSGTTLIIEKGKETSLYMGIKEYCLECSKVLDVKHDENEVYFMLDRVDGKFKVAARFKDGTLLVGKAPLSAAEPVEQGMCNWLYDTYLDGCIHERGSRCVGLSDRLAMVYLRGLAAVTREYAGFPTGDFEKMCDNACGSGRKPNRAQFNQRICRR
jgi:hypothetical protein